MNIIKKSMRKIIALIGAIITIFGLAQPVLASSGTGTFTGGQYGSRIYSTDNADSKYGFLIRKLIGLFCTVLLRKEQIQKNQMLI